MPKTPFILLLPFVIFLSGCAEHTKLDVTIVHGTIAVDGQTMAGINIVFHPSVVAEIPAFGSTDALRHRPQKRHSGSFVGFVNTVF